MMSEKMTETSIKTDMARIQTETDRSEGATMALHRIEVELDRARASEAEKDKALQEKDAAIKALADALEWLRSETDMGLITKSTATAVHAALRLAGRLP